MAWSKSRRITVMLVIDTVFLILELGVGIAVGSLALMADAFHMLNDIISLIVGLWAVKAALKSSTDKYSFGWLRAEILGAFFNAVFLIALCLSIVLEAVQRLIDPPEISSPILILIVGCLGLASNLAGLLVLGGHNHSHGPEEHAHSNGDQINEAEEGHGHGFGDGHSHSHASDERGDHTHGEAPGGVPTKARFRMGHYLKFSSSDDDPNGSHASNGSSPRRSRQRANSMKSSSRFHPEDFSIHPASFRQNIIAASRPQWDRVDGGDSTASEEEVEAEDERGPDENSPLMAKIDDSSSISSSSGGGGGGGGSPSHPHKHQYHEDPTNKVRHDSWHATHKHNMAKKPKKSGHNHDDMGMNAMILHVMGDALGNIGVIVSALIIWLTTWSARYYADPAVSLLITIIILHSTIPLTSATAKILLQATPDHIKVCDIKDDIRHLPGVLSCHHVHIWQLSDTQIVASLHIQVEFAIKEASERYMDLARAVRNCLHAYGIHSATIQPEFCLDKDHDHNLSQRGIIPGLDGISVPPRCGVDEDSCLIECVEDCRGKRCCSPQSAETQDDHGGS